MTKLVAQSVLLATLVEIILLSAAWAAETPSARSLDNAAVLERGFLDPPESPRPWVYWFWLNGNITKEGITADLEAMKRVGIGGVLIMEVDQGAPLGAVDFMSPRWREMFKHVVAEASRLGLEVNMNNDAGWNGSDLGLMWKPPFRADVTDLIKAGENRLEVKVVNLWPNRMIGDELLPEDSQRNANGTLKEWRDWLAEGKPSPTGRQTFTSWRLWKKDDPLLQSGLLGPVRIVAAESVELDH